VTKLVKFILLSGIQFVSPKIKGVWVWWISLMNTSLLAKWIWKLENSSGLWQKIVEAKYIKGRSVSLVKETEWFTFLERHPWDQRGVFYKHIIKKSIGVGARFWKDFLGAAIAPCLKKIKRSFSSILQ
jgi:hypothetical protein